MHLMSRGRNLTSPLPEMRPGPVLPNDTKRSLDLALVHREGEARSGANMRKAWVTSH